MRRATSSIPASAGSSDAQPTVLVPSTCRGSKGQCRSPSHRKTLASCERQPCRPAGHSRNRSRAARGPVELLDEVAADSPGAVLLVHGSDRLDGRGLVCELSIELDNDVLAVGYAGECASEGGGSQLAGRNGAEGSANAFGGTFPVGCRRLSRRTALINDSQPQEYPSLGTLLRVYRIGWLGRRLQASTKQPSALGRSRLYLRSPPLGVADAIGGRQGIAYAPALLRP